MTSARPWSRLLAPLAALAVAACSDTTEPQVANIEDTPPTRIPGVPDDAPVCDAGDEAFVRRALLHLFGRRPLGRAEVDLWTDVVAHQGRDAALDAMMASPEFVDAWQHVIRDMLYIPRMGMVANEECSGAPLRPNATPDLAAWVRDHGPLDTGAGDPWNFTDLVRSALLLDDLSVIFRMQPFIRMGPLLLMFDDPNDEIAWRKINAGIFERAFLNRRLDCMSCHNSEWSTTGTNDPATDRTWEVPGLFEKAIYGASDGRKATDLHAMFRITGVVSLVLDPDDPDHQYWKSGPGLNPWGIAKGCGQFIAPGEITPDPLGNTGHLVDDFGDTASVFDLENLLRESFAALRRDGVVLGNDKTVAGRPALAWLIAMTFTERVWEQLTGARLTVAHGFPRNRYQRDLLKHLASRWVDGGYSLEAVVKAALLHPLFNATSPEDCGGAATDLPAVLNPFLTGDAGAVGNGLGELIVRAPPRWILRAAARALEWTTPPDAFFRTADEKETIAVNEDSIAQRDLGIFLFEGDPGFRGASFQEALAWEDLLGTCTDPYADTSAALAPDWIDRLIGAASADTPLGDLVSSLKDRLLADPDLSDPAERAVLEALLGAPLTTPLAELATPGSTLHRACLAFLQTPEFNLDGAPITAAPGTVAPVVVPDDGPAARCAGVVALLPAGAATCSPDGALSWP